MALRDLGDEGSGALVAAGSQPGAYHERADLYSYSVGASSVGVWTGSVAQRRPRTHRPGAEDFERDRLPKPFRQPRRTTGSRTADVDVPGASSWRRATSTDLAESRKSQFGNASGGIAGLRADSTAGDT